MSYPGGSYRGRIRRADRLQVRPSDRGRKPFGGRDPAQSPSQDIPQPRPPYVRQVNIAAIDLPRPPREIWYWSNDHSRYFSASSGGSLKENR